MKSKNKSKAKANSYAAAYNEPVISFPSSDTLGGAAVLQDSGSTETIVVQEPQDPQRITDPIISEIDIVNMKDGGGIVKGIYSGNTTLDTNMNPAITAPPIVPAPVDSTTTTKKINWFLIAVAVAVLVGIFYLSKKK